MRKWLIIFICFVLLIGITAFSKSGKDKEHTIEIMIASADVSEENISNYDKIDFVRIDNLKQTIYTKNKKELIITTKNIEKIIIEKKLGILNYYNLNIYIDNKTQQDLYNLSLKNNGKLLVWIVDGEILFAPFIRSPLKNISTGLSSLEAAIKASRKMGIEPELNIPQKNQK